MRPKLGTLHLKLALSPAAAAVSIILFFSSLCEALKLAFKLAAKSVSVGCTKSVMPARIFTAIWPITLMDSCTSGAQLDPTASLTQMLQGNCSPMDCSIHCWMTASVTAAGWPYTSQFCKSPCSRNFNQGARTLPADRPADRITTLPAASNCSSSLHVPSAVMLLSLQ